MKVINKTDKDQRICGVTDGGAWEVTIPANHHRHVHERVRTNNEFCRLLTDGVLRIEEEDPDDEEPGAMGMYDAIAISQLEKESTVWLSEQSSTDQPIPYKDRKYPTRQDMRNEIERLSDEVVCWKFMHRLAEVFIVIVTVTYIGVITHNGRACG